MELLKEDAIAVVDDARKGEVNGLKRHVVVIRIDLDEAANDQLFSWIKSVRIFKIIAKNNVHQNIRNMTKRKLS